MTNRQTAFRTLQLFIFSAALVLLADRKSTRLNSSHDQISYAVFCLKKKKKNKRKKHIIDTCSVTRPMNTQNQYISHPHNPESTEYDIPYTGITTVVVQDPRVMTLAH